MSLESFASGRPTLVEVAAIERELTRLWKDAAHGSGDEPSPVTRACLLNLIVVTRAGAGMERDRVLAEVVRERPARMLLVEEDAALARDDLQAWISAQCTLPRAGQRQVCCEQVTIRYARGGAEHVPSLISALTASDLPTCLWIPGEWPADANLLDRLSALGDRLITDSIHLPAPAMKDLSRRAASPDHPPVADLNWARLRPLQLGIAGLFDSPLMTPVLDGVEGVRTLGGPGSGNASALASGWVSAALGGGRLDPAHEEQDSLQSGRLTRLVLEASGGSRVVAEQEPSGLWSARAEMPGACPLPRRTRFRPRGVSELLCDEMDRAGRDPLFESALALAA